MQEDSNSVQAVNSEEFGMTTQDYKTARVKTILTWLSLTFQKVEPVFVKIFNVTLYYLIRFIKSFVTSVFQMIKGGG